MSSMRRVRITNDGKAGNARVIDLETGREIPGAFEIDQVWHLDMKRFPSAVIDTYAEDFNVEADATIVGLCPGCMAQRSREARRERQALKADPRKTVVSDPENGSRNRGA